MAGDDPKSTPHEDNNNEGPYYDPYFEENLLDFISSPNDNLMDITFNEDPLPLPPPPPAPDMEINETGSLLQELSVSIPDKDTISEFLASLLNDDDNSLTWDMLDIPSDDLNDNIINNVVGEISIDNVVESGEASTHGFVENVLNFETGGTSTMIVPAITPTSTTPQGVFSCTCCNLLREIVHANGQEVMRLGLHGGIGYLCHAIVETQRFDGSSEPQYQTFHLMDLIMGDVKKFIEDYCAAREAGGFVVTQDTHADFYQAMNACSTSSQSLMPTLQSRDDIPMSSAMPDHEALNVPSVSLAMPDHQALNVPSVSLAMPNQEALNVPPVSQSVPPVLKERTRRRTPLAAQRERTGKLKLKDISMHFHLPIEEAARRMSLCPTVVKKICRKGGLNRWPHRKLKSLRKKISSTKKVLSTTTDVKVRERAEKEIDRLEKQMNDICREALQNA